MKYYSIRVEYGKKRTFVAREWVAEDAMGQFCIDWISTIREVFKWTKEINFRQYEDSYCEDGHGGEILAYTTTGRHTVNVRL